MNIANVCESVLSELRLMGPMPGVEVAMAEGVVTLRGVAPNEFLRRSLEQRLLALPEVMDVRNYLRVVAPVDKLEDHLLAMLAREGVAVADLRVAIEDGVVTLSGAAASWFDRDAMARAAWMLPGVREVVNQVRLPEGAVEPDMDAGGHPLP